MNYQISTDSYTATISILKGFQNSCPEKENIQISSIELGLIINQVFPSVVRSQKRIDGKRTWHYSLEKTSLLENSTLITWENLASITLNLGWHLNNNNNEFFEWIKIPSQDLCDGNSVVKKIKIYKDWNFAVRINNRNVTKETLGVQKLKPSLTSINYIFRALDEFVLCKGFPVVSRVTTKNSEGNTSGMTEEWKSAVDVSSSPKLFLRSVSCSVICQPGYKRGASELCDHCSLLKRNSVIFSKECEFVKKKRESYMSDEDLKEKIR